jgi:hypothetical protein
MPYEIPLNVIEILKSTLYLLEHTIYPGKDGKAVSDLKKCITGAIQPWQQNLARPSATKKTQLPTSCNTVDACHIQGPSPMNIFPAPPISIVGSANESVPSFEFANCVTNITN